MTVLFCFAVFVRLLIICECKYGYITWVGPKAEITISDYYADIPEVHVAKAMYTNEINETGWAFLEIHTSEDFPDEKQAYAAGFLEGYLSRELVWMHWQNMLKGYCFNKTDVCGLIEDFLNKNEEFLLDMVKRHPNDAYWYQLKLYYIQLEGLAMGYNDATENQYEYLTVRDIIWLNMLGDLDELSMALTMPRDTPAGYLFGADHCTGLVKLLPDHSDLYFSQVTWNSYQSMLRLQKMYALNYRLQPGSCKRIPGRKMALSSYPGMIQSTDDFYIMSSGLASAETTIGNSNRTLYDHVKPCGSVMEYARAMLANRLARDGREWTEVFRRYNSGTYNNQWYIVDYNKFQARSGATPMDTRPGLLWVLEQLPGYIEADDLTSTLLEAGFWPSYNIPFFPRVFNLSGGWERVRVFGDWFGYHTCPRGHIIRDEQAHIRNIRDMFWFLRYNDFKFDPRARCQGWDPPYNSANSIAARFDLNPANGSYPIMYLGHRSHGATDAKLTSSHLVKTMQFIAVASPTYNISRGIPPFMWSNFDLGPMLSHVGQPDLWMFSPILHQWEWT